MVSLLHCCRRNHIAMKPYSNEAMKPYNNTTDNGKQQCLQNPSLVIAKSSIE